MSEKMRRARWFLLGAFSAGAALTLVGMGEIRFGNGPFEINDVILTSDGSGGVQAWRARSRTDQDTGATVTTVDYLGVGSPSEGSVTTYTQLKPLKEQQVLNNRVVRQ